MICRETREREDRRNEKRRKDKEWKQKKRQEEERRVEQRRNVRRGREGKSLLKKIVWDQFGLKYEHEKILPMFTLSLHS